MARPRVFVSSTFYDLKYLRADLERFIKEFGYDAVLNEKGNIPYGSEEKLEDYCYREVDNTDILIAIIGGRYGSESEKEPYSITQMEIKTAHKLGKQVYIFIDKSVLSEYRMFLLNKDIENIRYSFVDDVKIFSFIEEIEALSHNNPISPFENSQEIIFFLREQWAGLFQRLLQQQSKLGESKTLENINATTQTLNKLVNFLTEERKNSDTAIKEILLSNHPVFQRLRDVTNTSYRIFFTNTEELEQWLKARQFAEKEFVEYDDFANFHEYKTESNDYVYYLNIQRSIFDENDKLKVYTQSDWNDEWVQLIKESKGITISEDDLPF
ncbi:DUF4062 domain-containing protein [Paenibacillus endoradicis]|uniref:DUF4062 domain-containing protein n=1 Tax=Paenibacillus endoradicis TaxID=2972487 RepID=UPI002158A5FE|nr:DUF4062 domain-containing protein [Paenibacillus endoradicis]MCR8659327.1 DUF4062 domain-containing protein [Paenibacillus endoradicis]